MPVDQKSAGAGAPSDPWTETETFSKNATFFVIFDQIFQRHFSTKAKNLLLHFNFGAIAPKFKCKSKLFALVVKCLRKIWSKMTKIGTFFVKVSVSVSVGQLVSVSVGWLGLGLGTRVVSVSVKKFWSRSIPAPPPLDPPLELRGLPPCRDVAAGPRRLRNSIDWYLRTY